jgi:mono/diheme cytochrome c family protein/glucose/arabinose dehydrogenase
MISPRRPHLLATASSLFLLLFSLHAEGQQGNRKGHDNMAQIVPEDLILPAPFLTPDEALKSFQLAPGFVIEPVVTEPLVEMPVALKFDPDGRMWVCEMRGYMPDIDGKGEETPQGRIVILEDTDNDGRVDKRTVFLDKLLLPRALCLTKDGLLFADQKNLLFIQRNGLLAQGTPEVVDKSYATSGNVEHKANALLLGLDNWIYSSKSDRRYRRIEGKWVMEPTMFRGQWGLTKDNHGHLYHNNNSNLLYGDRLLPNTVHGNPGSKMSANIGERIGNNRVWPSRVTPGLNRAYISSLNGYESDTIDPKSFKLINTTAACGPEIYRGNNFPSQGETTAYICESSANLIKAITVSDADGKRSGAHPYGEREFLTSTDERFRPVNLYTAPDGCLYILDMYHGIIQHKTYVTSYLRKYTLSQGLDTPSYGHGRIYRIRHESKPRGPAPQLAHATTKELIKTLNHPNGWWRDTAQELLIRSGESTIKAPLEKLLMNSPKAVGRHHALWTLEGLGLLEPKHISALFTNNQDPHLLAAALTAALSLSPEALAELENDLIELSSSGDLAVYRNRLLAQLGSERALAEAAKTLLENSKQKFLAEATMSGLAGHEEGFAKANQGRYQNSNFEKWLATSLRATTSGPVKEQGPKLAGAHLAAFKKGKTLYHTSAACIACHGANGAGLPNLGPPLDSSEWVTGSEEILIKILLHGMQGPIKVAGEQFTPAAAMPGLGANPALDDPAIAAIATYIRHEWDNRAPLVQPATVQKVRKVTKARTGRPYTEDELRSNQ